MAKPESFDEDLATGLKAAKSKRMYFAVVMKGAADGALIVSKTKVPPADIAAAKKKSGGSSVIRGLCFGKDGEHVFETAKEPPATLARLLKTLAKRDANLVINAVCCAGADPELADESAAAPAAGAAAPAARATNAPAAGAPQVKPGTPAGTAPVTGPAPGASAAPASKAAPAGKAAPAPGAQPPPDRGWLTRLNGLAGQLKQVQAANPQIFPKIQAEVLKARSFGQNNDTAQANATLDTVDKLIAKILGKPAADDAAAKSPAQPAAKPAAKSPVSAKNFAAAAARWTQTVNEVFADIGRLQGKIRSSYPQESATAAQLTTLLRRFPKSLAETLKAGSQAKEPAAIAANRAAALKSIGAFRVTIATDPLIGIVDNCPFEKMNLGARLSAALTDLGSQLAG